MCVCVQESTDPARSISPSHKSTSNLTSNIILREKNLKKTTSTSAVSDNQKKDMAAADTGKVQNVIFQFGIFPCTLFILRGKVG